jgi:hypothetical protein
MNDVPPPSRERYLKQAEQAEALAQRASSPQERAAFEDIARLWRDLADRRPASEG